MYIKKEKYELLGSFVISKRPDLYGSIIDYGGPEINNDDWIFFSKLISSLKIWLGIEKYELEFAFIDTQSENPCCWQPSSTENYILFPMGFVAKVEKYAFAASRHPLINKALKFENEFIDFSRDPDLSNELEQQYDKIQKNPNEHDGFRKIFQLSIAFAFGHEIGHLLNGHLALKHIISQKYEYNQNQLNHFITMQTLEMDADSIGVQVVFGIIFNEIPENFSEFFSSLGTDCAVTFCSVAIACALFSNSFFTVRSVDALSSFNYPCLLRRYSMAHTALTERFARKFSITTNVKFYKEFIQHFGPSHEFIMQYAINVCKIDTKDLQSSSENFINDLPEYDEKILKRWSTIRPILENRKMSAANLAQAQRPPECNPDDFAPPT